MTDEYVARKQTFNQLLTLYGRKVVLEALQQPEIEVVRLHLATSNKPGPELAKIEAMADAAGAETRYHTREALARISRNGRQDQGVAVDLRLPGYRRIEDLPQGPAELLALDRVTNPQNLGMIIRVVAGSPIDGLILPRQGCARIDSLVIKASAGTIFRARIYHCETLTDALDAMPGAAIFGLDGKGTVSINDLPPAEIKVLVLGNESDGLSSNIRSRCSQLVRIPLANGVESLNVSTAAAIVAFRSVFQEASN